MPRDKLPDILRPTELCDFGDIFRTSPRPARLLVAAAGLAGLLAVAHFVAQDAVRAEDPITVAAQPHRL